MNKSKLLKTKHVMELVPTAPFNFDATMYKPDHFPSADTDWEPGIRWQTMLWQKRPLGLKFENQGAIDQPKVSLSIWSTEQLDQSFLSRLSDELNYRYNPQLDLMERSRITARWRRPPTGSGSARRR